VRELAQATGLAEEVVLRFVVELLAINMLELASSANHTAAAAPVSSVTLRLHV
jgi:hypothetical protein